MARNRGTTARDDKADDGSPGATWKRLCTVGVEARRERHPLAALRVFIVAALREGMNESRIAFRDGAVTMPRLVALGVELLRQANDRDSPRDLARAALRALEHDVPEEARREAAGAELRALAPQDFLGRINTLQKGGRELAKIASDHAMRAQELRALIRDAEHKVREAERGRRRRAKQDSASADKAADTPDPERTRRRKPSAK